MALQQPRPQNSITEQSRSLLQGLAALREVEASIASGVETSVLTNLVLEKVESILPDPSAASLILTLNRQTGKPEPIGHRNLREKSSTVSAWEIWSPFSNTVFQTKAPLTVRDLREDTSVAGVELFHRHGWISYAGFPLIAGGESLGVLSIYTGMQDGFTEERIAVLSLLAARAAAAMRQTMHLEQVHRRLRELENDNKLKNQFLSGLSMELRAPLNSIVGYASLLQDRLLGEIIPQQENAVAALLRSCRDQLRVINGIMEVMKVETLKEQVIQGVRPLGEAMDEFERDVILHALKTAGFNQTKAASLLKTTRRILRYKMEKLNLVPPFSEVRKKDDGAESGSAQEEE